MSTGLKAPDSKRHLDHLECEFPKMQIHAESLLVRLRISQAPTEADRLLLAPVLDGTSELPYTFRSRNSASFRVLPLPYLSNVVPHVVFNLASTKSLNVTGENFQDAKQDLLCILTG